LLNVESLQHNAELRRDLWRWVWLELKYADFLMETEILAPVTAACHHFIDIDIDT
jgi:hypothetical protein